MGKFSNIMTAAMVTLTITSGSALADTWRMATKMPADSPEGKVFQRFADLTEEYSNGELIIDVYPNEQLGKEDAILEQVQMGIVNIYAEGFGYMKKWVPELVWSAAPFVFDDYDHWVRFMEGDLMQSWFAKAADVAGIAPLGNPTTILRGPYRVILSNKPVNSLDDIQGLKLRMHANKVAIDSWSHLGAEVITLPWTDVYPSIEKGIVEAVNSPIALVQPMRFNEVAPYIGRTDEYWQSVGFMMNLQAYEALDQDTKDALLKAYNEAGEYSREVMFDFAEKSVEEMVADGATFVEIDTAPFVESMKSFYEQMDESGELPDGFLEAVDAARAE
ncbi:TRAP transporter substrate-binding protein [Thalassospira sp. MA62]|nr:TRAP transporter substrate-binding protein [Thalassospira sp. MA62]